MSRCEVSKKKNSPLILNTIKKMNHEINAQIAIEKRKEIEGLPAYRFLER
jgi:hypothetical protein